MRTALIGIDYIVDIMHSEGRIARSAAQAADRDVVGSFNTAASIARTQRWPVILVKVGFGPGYPDLPRHSPLFGRAQELGALDLAGPGTSFHPDLDVADTDIVLTKPRVNAFFGTRLSQVLSGCGVDRVVIGGVSTTMAVQSTARDAHDRDYQVTILEDACAAPTAAEHRAGIDMLRGIASVVTTATLHAPT